MKDPRLYLILLCDRKAKEVRVNIANQSAINNIRYIGSYITTANQY